jgi:mannose-6-phosphate isomerase-like protein (cupin superfamily)
LNLQPYFINFEQIGNKSIGYISVSEFSKHIPFEVKRIYWTYSNPENLKKGEHAHKNSEQILVAISGEITITLEKADSEEVQTFILTNENQGLYIPPQTWLVIKYSQNAVLLAFSSIEYDANDYIRSYDDFKKQ